MSLIRLFRRTLFRIFTLTYPFLLFLIVLWGESLNYFYSRLFWHIPLPKTENSIGILIVADPQLIGFQNENHMIGPLTRWDSDRFLWKGFGHAVEASSPDLIVFLGDLFDEGLEASETELQWTLDRFHSIFQAEIPKIFISGDNDVGGEVEPVQSLLTTRFSRVFPNSYPIFNEVFISLTLTEVNLMNGEVKSIRKNSSPPELNVILSHVPFARSSYHRSRDFVNVMHIYPPEWSILVGLSALYSRTLPKLCTLPSILTPVAAVTSTLFYILVFDELPYIRKPGAKPWLLVSLGMRLRLVNVNNGLNVSPLTFQHRHTHLKIASLSPDLILSAHDHKAFMHNISRDGNAITSTDLKEVFGIQQASVGRNLSVLELQTPTCSYRMGVLDVGYGFLRIDRLDSSNQYRVSISILWLSSRFYVLFLYSIILALGFLALSLQMGLLFYSKRSRYRLLRSRTCSC